jgi:hypothetical protein
VHTRCGRKGAIYVRSARFHFTKEAVSRGITFSQTILTAMVSVYAKFQLHTMLCMIIDSIVK